jgi:hypothetical protein
MNLLAYTPFIQPLPMHHWYLWLLPLCAGVSIVYKSIKCHRMATVPREALVIFITILSGIVLAAAVLVALVKLMA